MENISIEQIIKVKPPKYAIAIKVAMILISIISLFFIFISYMVILTAVLIVLTVIVFRYFNAEYEYTLVEKELVVDKIIARSYRRTCNTFNLSKLEIMAPLGSEKLVSFEQRKCRTHDYSSNNDMSKCYVIFAPTNNEMVRLVLEPNERMKDSLWKIAPSKVTL